MRHEWVLDVLSDLKAFAQANGLGTLSDHLDTTLALAAAEIAKIDAAPRREDVREPNAD